MLKYLGRLAEKSGRFTANYHREPITRELGANLSYKPGHVF